MTSSELEAMVKDLNTRTTAIEQILPTLATKDDLKAFATKDDLKAFATKEDLRQGLAATLAEAKQFTLVLYEDLKDDIGLLSEHLAHVMQVVDRIDRRG
jgi:hypothetical protein